MPAINRSRSLSPSLLSNTQHRYLPYRKINSTFSFGMALVPAPAHAHAHAPGPMRASPESEMYACNQLGNLHLSEQVQLGSSQPMVRAMSHGPRHPAQRPMLSHRRAVSLSSIQQQHSQAYILIPNHHPQAQAQAHPHVQVQTQAQAHTYAPRRRVPHPLVNLRHPSPPLTPIVESPIPRDPISNLVNIHSRIPTPPQLPAQARAQAQAQKLPVLSKTNLAKVEIHHQRHLHHQHQLQRQARQQAESQQRLNQSLMLVTPTMAAYLKKGGSVNVKAPDGKSWRIRAPQMIVPASMVSPTCGMRMMRMQ